MENDIVRRLRATDWTDKPEATICSQLVTSVLILLGYGEHTLHKVAEQQSYKLNDPTTMKGSRRIRLDYQPRVYEEGLWVMEAKGTDRQVTAKTLGQVRDYAIHPEIRAALMVTVDRAGFQVFDPWDEHWDSPLLSIPPNEVADRIEDLRAVLGVDRVGDVVRRRHLDHLRRALSASLEFGVLLNAEQEFRELLKDARKTIDGNRIEIHRKVMREHEDLHGRVLKASGAWGVAQHHNSPWAGSQRDTQDLARAVLMQDEAQRPTQLRLVWKAIEAVYKNRCPEGTSLCRPLWWLHIVVLGSCLQLRGEPGCEPDATEMAHQAIRDSLLGFPDDDSAAASLRLQRMLIPLAVRLAAKAPLEQLSAEAKAGLSAEDRIRYRFDPAWFLMHDVTIRVIKKFTEIEPWNRETLEAEAKRAAALLEETPIPDGEWVGPIGDPWLATWQQVDPLLLCGVSVLSKDPSGDDLLTEPELQQAISNAANSEHQYLSRFAIPVAERLGIRCP
jgi:hypothetical protein